MTAIRLLLAALLAAVGLVVLTPAASFACSCVAADDARFEEWADAVFTGTLVHVEPPTPRPDGVLSTADPNTYRFTVHEVTKGAVPLVTEVRSAISGASCGLENMQVGATYLVYATEEHGGLTTGLCSGTHRTAPPAETARPTGLMVVGDGVAALLARWRGFLGLWSGS